jgi:APA family basic amino acid/polyamine antiporter
MAGPRSLLQKELNENYVFARTNLGKSYKESRRDLRSMTAKTRPTTFLREATGLVREFTWFDGMMLGVAMFLPSVAFFVLFGVLPFLWPGSSAVLTIGVFGTLVLIPLLLVYSVLSAAMPRSGGDYVYVSRSISPALGFGTSLVFIIFAACGSLGAQGYFIPTMVIAPHLAALGSIYNNESMVAFAQNIVTPAGIMAIGTILLLVTFLLVSIAPHTFRRLYSILFIISFLGYPVLFVLSLAFSTNQQFISSFDSYATSAGLNTSYAAIIDFGNKAGVVVPQSIMASLLAFPFIMFTVSFPQQAGYIGGEIKQGSKQISWGMATAMFACTIMTGIAGYFVYNTIGYDFLSAVTYWANSGSPGYPLPGAPFMTFFLAVLYPNLGFNIFMLIAGIIWSFVLMVAMAIMVSRAIFAWAFDRVVPGALADVNERLHTPVKANAIACVGGFVFVVAYAYNFLGVFFNAVAAWTSAYVIVMISAVVLPFTNKAVFGQSPAWVRKKIGAIPIMSIFGILGTAVTLLILYFIVAQPSISGVNPPSIILIIGVYLTGIIAYYVARSYRKSQGIDLELAFKQIPPE